MNAQKEEYEKKLKEMELANMSGISGNSQTNMEEYLRQVQKDQSQKEIEFERERKRIGEMEKIIKRRKVMLKKLEKKLGKVSSTVCELNLMAKELNKKVKFSLDLGPGFLSDESAFENLQDIIRVKIVNEEVGHLFYWDLNKLQDRYDLIKDILDRFFEEEAVPSLDHTQDPFWDPEEAADIGRAFISLKPLAFMFDDERLLKVYVETEVVGDVAVRIEPCDKSGLPLKPEEMEDITEPMQLIGRQMYFSVRLGKASINPFYTRQCFFQYRLNADSLDQKDFVTCKVQSDSGIIDFDYFEVHSIESVDQSTLVFLSDTKVPLHTDPSWNYNSSAR
jgi:hypothetical protein